MLSGDFGRKLRKLNKHLRIYYSNNETKPAGLYCLERGECVPICGIDKNDIPRYTIANEQNKILKSGWQRTLRVLIHKGLVTRRAVERLFGPLDHCKVVIHKETDEVTRIKDLTNKKLYYGDIDRNGQPIFNRNEVLDMQAELLRR